MCISDPEISPPFHQTGLPLKSKGYPQSKASNVRRNIAASQKINQNAFWTGWHSSLTCSKMHSIHTKSVFLEASEVCTDTFCTFITFHVFRSFLICLRYNMKLHALCYQLYFGFPTSGCDEHVLGSNSFSLSVVWVSCGELNLLKDTHFRSFNQKCFFTVSPGYSHEMCLLNKTTAICLNRCFCAIAPCPLGRKRKIKTVKEQYYSCRFQAF